MSSLSLQAMMQRPRPKREIPEGYPLELDPNIDENDVDAMIVALQAKVDENVIPELYEHRLKRYLAKKKEHEELQKANPGLSLEVCLRLRTLQGMLDQLEKEGPGDLHIPNIKAIMDAYRSGDLKIVPGLVTHWARGAKVAGPMQDGNTVELFEKYARPEGYLWTERGDEQILQRAF